MYMMIDFDFNVGTRERHNIHFHFNQFAGNLWIKIDDKDIIKDFRMYSMSLTKNYEFTVGTDERHDVLIAKTRKFFAAGYRKQTCQVFVDGELLEEH